MYKKWSPSHGLLLILLISPLLAFTAPPRSAVSNHLQTQFSLYPQEKLYVHTDKPYYIAGDTIWLRAHVVDARTHRPSAQSKYVYAELQSLAKPLSGEQPPPPVRIRIMERDGVYAGFFPLPMTTPGGDYELTAYTTFMRNPGPDYFYRTNIYIGKYGTRYEQRSAKRSEERNFDVTFYPEGGYLVAGVPCIVGFKSLRADGSSVPVTGRIVDDKGAEIAAFESLHAGIGKVCITAEEGRIYYAECTAASGDTKRFRLPAARTDACVVQVFPTAKRFSVGVAAPKGYDTKRFALLIHCRGELCYYGTWDSRKEYQCFDRYDFPDGVLQVLLLDAQGAVLSERLVFCFDTKQQTQFGVVADKPAYGRREKVVLDARFTGVNGKPIAGNVSVSVTDNRVVDASPANNILTSLLLESELRGYVEHPAYYFDPSQPTRQVALDALMLTQGWRRYNIPKALRGDYEHPREPLEVGQEITGRIRKTGILRSKNFNGYTVSAMAPRFGFYTLAQVDSAGRFTINGFDFPDSTSYVLSATGPDGRTDVDMLIDAEQFPEPRKPMPIPDRAESMESYNRNLKLFTDSLKNILLDAVVVSAMPRATTRTASEILAVRSVDSKNIEAEGYNSIEEALRGKHGVVARQNELFLFGAPVVYAIDGTIWERIDEYEEKIPTFIPMNMIKRIDLVPPVNSTLYGSQAKGLGVIVITTKTGSELLATKMPDMQKVHMQSTTPLGFQQPAEFYAPKYDTPNRKNSYERDLRTTLYWNPAVQIGSDGKVRIEFYTGDEGADYSVRFEGVSARNGEIISHTGRCPAQD